MTNFLTFSLCAIHYSFLICHKIIVCRCTCISNINKILNQKIKHLNPSKIIALQSDKYIIFYKNKMDWRYVYFLQTANTTYIHPLINIRHWNRMSSVEKSIFTEQKDVADYMPNHFQFLAMYMHIYNNILTINASCNKLIPTCHS